jgi:hypothetical protein
VFATRVRHGVPARDRLEAAPENIRKSAKGGRMENTSHGQGMEIAPVSVGNWMITLLLASIPVVNVICTLVWAFAGGTHPSKANFAKALLAWFALTILLVLLMAGSFTSLMQQYMQQY